MRLVEVLVRFYKSFNFDYERKTNPNATPVDWEKTEAGWYPHIRVSLEDDITAIVGANESGKSHLLDAIELLLGADSPDPRDFCRYSPLFSAEIGLRRSPELGGRFSPSQVEIELLREAGIALQGDDSLFLLRPAAERWEVIPADGVAVQLDGDALDVVRGLLPLPIRLHTNIPVPDALPIRLLAGASGPSLSRQQRRSLLGALSAATSQDLLTQQVPALFAQLADAAPLAAGNELGRQLLIDVARIDPSSFADLTIAIEAEEEGLVNGLIQTMNDSISRHLTLSRWWTQDADFSLRLSPREHEVVFTIRDRTGTDYSFKERSTGLRYFLSYYIQLRSHQMAHERPQILLMDEPDTYLSARGQQDLLRVLEHHVRPDGQVTEDQVVYVTHSPFLINRNAGHRIRVLDKGSGEEGTRVVKDASIRRYEPLRSSLGSYVAETAFIGGANLFVEGLSDQVLLAELSTILRLEGVPASQTLDLNETTIVPSGSASSVPYMVYLARGQDEVKPPCVALLDSDQSGQDARRQLLKGGAYGRRLLPEDAILMLGEWAAGVEGLIVTPGVMIQETEDLIPLAVAVPAARRYAEHLLNEVDPERLTVPSVEGLLAANNGSLFDALARAFADTFDAKLEKVGFAKEIIRYVREPRIGSRPPGVPALEGNFAALVAELVDRIALVSIREDEARRVGRVQRTVDGFVRDFPEGATRDRANVALRELEAAAGETDHGDQLRQLVAGLRRDYKLAADPMAAVDDYEAFKNKLGALKYVDRLANQGELKGPVGKEGPPRARSERQARTRS